MAPTTSATGITWDLSDLYASPADPQLQATLDAVQAEAEAFAQTYRGTINVPGGPAPTHLLEGLRRLETLYDQLGRPAVYAGLLFAGDTAKPENRNLEQQIEQRNMAIYNLVLFFHLEWLDLRAEDAQRLIAAESLAPYSYYLLNARKAVPHKLTEAEEKLVNEKDVTGNQAWVRLFTELTSSLEFPLELEGEKQALTLDAILTLMRHPDRNVRQKAFTTLYAVLETQSQTLAYIYNTLIQDKLMMDRLRNYSNPMQPRHLANQVPPEAVETMMEVVEQNYDIAQSYFRLKAKMLNLPKLEIYDQHAPLGEVAAHITYNAARDVILEAFAAFEPQFREIASLFYERNWIDAEVRPGKRGGGFCSGYPPSNHPYILVNYTDNMQDAMTVAHELGHGIHFWLARKQTLFNFDTSLPLAETASVFAEMIVFEHLLGQTQDKADKLALLCSKIQDIFSTVFRQNVLTRFEQAAFAGRAENRLTPEQLSECWLEANQRYYGTAVEQTKGYELGWSYIPHFIHTPFYCYSYVFGELLVLALYGKYREEGKAFIPRYVALLEAGGSQAPETLLKDLGFDLRDPAFWQLGFNEIRRLVAWAEELAAV